MKRFVSILLLLALLLGCLPVSVLADGEGYFYFSAEGDGKLLVSPQKIPFTAGQTFLEALQAAGISLTYDNSYLSAVEGVTGNYKMISSPADKLLDSTPADGDYFCITEKSAASVGTGWQTLILQMIAYDAAEADVQKAASAAYNAAKASYCGVTDEAAQSLAQTLETAISDYKKSLDDTHTVTFQGADSDYSAYTITAENAYGREFPGENGTISLPNGTFTFRIGSGNKSVSGEVTVNGAATTVTGLPAIPTEEWIDAANFEVSAASGYSNNGKDFTDKKFAQSINDFTVTATVPDTFSSNIYPYFCTTTSAPSGASITANYTDANGTQQSADVTAEAKTYPLTGTLSRGAVGNTVIFRVSVKVGDYAQNEELTLQLDRQPTLSGLYLEGSKYGTRPAADKSFSGTELAYTYKILSEDAAVTVYPTAAFSGYTITVDTQPLDANGGATVTVTGGKQSIPVVVSKGNYSTTYTLTVVKGESTDLTFYMKEKDAEIRLFNANGEELKSSTKDNTSGYPEYYFNVVRGEQYTYFATVDTYYHAEETFTVGAAEESKGINVTVKNASVSPKLKTLALSEDSHYTNANYRFTLSYDGGTGFSDSQNAYEVSIPDTYGSFYVWADPEGAASCTMLYQTLSASTAASERKVTPNETTDTSGGTTAHSAILQNNARGNTLTFRVSQKGSGTESDITYSTDYVVNVKRDLSLENLTIRCGGNNSALNFASTQKEYTITVPESAGFLELTPTAHSTVCYGDDDSGYILLVNGEEAKSGEAFQVKLNGSMTAETITVTLQNRFDESVTSEYTIAVTKTASNRVKFSFDPADAVFYIYDQVSGTRLWPDSDGAYAFSAGFTYIYSLTMSGYIGQSGAIQLSGSQLLFGYMQTQTDKTEKFVQDKSYSTSGTITLTLEKAKENAAIKKLTSEWPNFRGNENNNGVTNAPTPVDAEDGTLYWAVKVGDGYDSKAVSSPILVGDALIVYAGTSILKIDKDTGKTLLEKPMADASSFAINNPTYADGVVLVGLSNGRIQAFNADTLDSLWIYKDPLGGQPNCPITVHDGYAYTGFWNSEEKNAAFVCLSLTDEDPAQPQESKPATWRYVQKGGFYWAGAYVNDNFVMVGTDDGYGGYSHNTAELLLLDTKTGKLLDSMKGFAGDIRSTICYDTDTNAYYFTSKGGYFYSVKVTGGSAWKLTDKKQLSLGGMSTSTPVVDNGRAYVGVSGTGQFTPYSGHKIAVIDLPSTSNGTPYIEYSIETQGYPQTSGLLTTAYGVDYIYFFDNYTPGKLRAVRDAKGQSAVYSTYWTKEVVGSKSYNTAYALFTPDGGQAQYAICSPIVDANGTMYFKNDSAYLMAYGSAVKELKVDNPPTKLEYNAGDTFDMTGLKVTATYQNGKTRDVTKLMALENPNMELTEADDKVTIKYAPNQTMYHNEPNTTDNTMKAGVPTTNPDVVVPITVGKAVKTGSIGGIEWSYSSGKLTLSGTFSSGAKLVAAVYDTEGKLVGTRVFTKAAADAALASGTKIRLFLLDSDGKPLTAAQNVKD